MNREGYNKVAFAFLDKFKDIAIEDRAWETNDKSESFRHVLLDSFLSESSLDTSSSICSNIKNPFLNHFYPSTC